MYKFLYKKKYIYTCIFIYIYMYVQYIRIHNAPALPACNWSKARLVPPLGWTNGYAQAKANPCASSSTTIATSFSTSNNVLLLPVKRRSSPRTLARREKMRKLLARNKNFALESRAIYGLSIIVRHTRSHIKLLKWYSDIDLLYSAYSCQRAIKSRAGNSNNPTWSYIALRYAFLWILYAQSNLIALLSLFIIASLRSHCLSGNHRKKSCALRYTVNEM